MKRSYSVFAALAIALSLGLAAPGMAMTHGHSKMMAHKCPAGQHWVHGYMRGKTKVHGYCHK